MARRYRFEPLLVPDEADVVATLDGDGNLLKKDGSQAPQIVVIKPDNSEGVADVDLDEAAYPTGTRVVIEDVHGAASNNITVTPLGSFVDPDGVAVDQVVINADDGYAILDIVGGLTVVSASKGVDLTA